MRYEYNTTFRLTLINPPFHVERNMDSRGITATLAVDSATPINPGEAYVALRDITTRMQGSNWIAVDDAYMLKLLEPKTGNTVHNFLTRLKDQLAEPEATYVRLGNTVPSDTVNGYVVYALRAGRPPCLEAAASVIFEELRHAAIDVSNVTLTLDDGKLRYTAHGTDPTYFA